MSMDKLNDKLEIQQLVCKYSRAIDRRDFTLLSKLYAENSIDHHGGMFEGSGKDYIEWVQNALKNTSHTSHQIFNHLIEIDPNDPNYAEGEVYSLNVHIMKNEKEEEKNLNTTLLLESDNEEAMYMLINIYLKKSNYLKIKELKENFSIICTNLCDKTKIINEALKNIEPKNES